MPVPTITLFLARVLYFLAVLNSLVEQLFLSATEDIFPSAQMKFSSIQFGSSSWEHLRKSPGFRVFLGATQQWGSCWNTWEVRGEKDQSCRGWGMGHSPGLQEKERSEREMNPNLGRFSGFPAANAAPELVNLHLHQYPPSHFHIFNHRCFQSHPYSPNIKFGKNVQSQTLKMRVCLIIWSPVQIFTSFQPAPFI